MDTPLFYFFLAIHLTSLIVGMGSVIVIDTFGLLWMLKKIHLSFVMRVATITQRMIWVGWGGLVLSGTGLILLKGYVDNLTMMKLFFVALVGANGFFLHTIKRSMESIKSEHLSPVLLFRMTLATTISQVGWWSAIAIGFLHRHWEHRIDWPHFPEVYMAGIATGIIVIALLGEAFFHGSKLTRK